MRAGCAQGAAQLHSQLRQLHPRSRLRRRGRLNPIRFLRGAFATLLLACASVAHAQDPSLAVHLLDYIAVDYEGAVADGKVKSADEYKEMTEFSANVVATIGKLPAVPAKADLDAQAAKLAQRVAAKADPAEVSAIAHKLRNAVVAAYNVAIGPKKAPDLARAATLYAENCAACHGATGKGDGPAGAALDPKPSDFHERERQQNRSTYGLFNTLTRGVEGTSMRSFKELSDEDRWALAYYAANFGATDAERARGQALWAQAKDKSKWRSHSSVAGRTVAEIRAEGGDDAAAMLAYLRANPALIDQGKPSPIAFSRQKLAESVQLRASGNVDGAVQAALTSYLEGYELVETSLGTVDNALMRRIEGAMIDFRNLLKSGAPQAEVEARAKEIDALLEKARETLDSGGLSPGASFLASYIILLREGLEAVLVVVALLAFLRRGGQAHAVPYLHAGWIAALVAGGLTWYAANRLVQISGADREVTEGVSALVASAMLLYVGFWLHGKSSAQAWQGFLMRGAQGVKGGAAWGLAFMAFLAVYREIFETVLFYEALWAQSPDQGHAIVAGLLAATATLAAVTWAMLRYSVRMPLGLFFGASGMLLAVIAVILAGNGVAALQEAGWIPVTPVPLFTFTWLGIHPNLQSLGTQAVLIVLIVFLWRLSSRARPASQPA